MKRLTPWYGMALLAVTGCAPLAPVPTATQLLIAQRGGWPTATMTDLERGRISYLERCAGCHAPYRPERFPSEMWPRLVADMRRNANLYNPEDETDIVRYLVSTAEDARTAPDEEKIR